MPQDIVPLIVLALVPLFLVAAGQALVMIGGGIDLSIPGMVAVGVATGARVKVITSSLLAGLVAMLAAGALMGLLNGLAAARLRLPPHVITLGTLGLFSGLALAFPTARTGPAVPLDLESIGSNMPAWVGVALLVGVALHLGLEKLVFGRWLRAAGFNRDGARTAGVPVARVTIGAYVVSGLCAALAAVFYAAQPEAGSSVPSLPFLLVDVVGAAVIGGVGFSGGRGGLAGVLAGAATMAALGVILSTVGLPPSPVLMVKSAVLLAVAALGVGRGPCI